MRIISEELWFTCEKRKDSDTSSKTRKKSAHYVKNPLGGLVYCGVCGSVKTLANRRRFVCSSFRQHRCCKNSRGMDDEQIPWHIFRVLQEEIAAKSPAKWKSFFRKACGKDLAEAKKASRQIQSLEDNISCLIRSVEKRGVEMDEIVAKFDNLNEERVQLRSCIYKRTVLVEGNVQVELAAAIEELRIGLLHKQKNDIWRAQPDKLLDKVILHPITESRTGETIDVQLKPDSWVEFYRMLKIGSYESPSTPCHAVAI